MPTAAFLTRENLEAAFRELGLRARAAEKIVEIAVYGGSALVLTLPGRVATKDVDAESKRLFRTYPSEDQAGLRVLVASPHYLFAMKCLAMRIGGADETQDRSDIDALAKTIKIYNAEQALEIVSQYYPSSQIPPKTRFGTEELFPSRVPPGDAS
jgi:hypothetical protein